MRKIKLTAAVLLAGTRAAAMQTTPVINGSLSGGQYFFQKQKGSFAGNAALTAAALMKIDERWSVLPMYSGAFQGTKGVDDAVGAGTLFQQQMDHRLSATGIRSFGGGWRLKPSASYKRQFLKETRDETWGHGLFDYEKIALGLETERIYKDPFSWKAAVDVYRVRFPNYQSLESRSGVDPFGNPLNRELAPTNVLDTMNYSLTLAGARPFPFNEPKYVLQGGVSALYQSFLDQRLVNARGQFDAAGRRDMSQNVYGSVGRPLQVTAFGEKARLDLSMGANVTYLRSNQNSYDATFAQYVPNAYSYWTFGVGPSANLSWGEKKQPSWLQGGLRWSRQNYLGRLTQDGDGVYLSQKQRQDRVTLSMGYGHPIAPDFTLTFRTNFLWAASNHHYEKTYSYTYRAVNYLLGVAYEY